MFSSSILLELELELAVLLEELCLRRLWTETESKLVLVFLSLIERNPDDPFWSTPLFSWCIRNCSRPCCSTNHEIRPSSSRLLLLLLRGAGEIFQCEEDGMAWLGLKSSLTHMSYARHNVHTHTKSSSSSSREAGSHQRALIVRLDVLAKRQVRDRNCFIIEIVGIHEANCKVLNILFQHLQIMFGLKWWK